MAGTDSTRPIITRAEAKRFGLKRYFPGSNCVSGHVAERTTADGQCCECCRLKMRARRAILRRDAIAAATSVFRDAVDRAKTLVGAPKGNAVIVDRKVAKAAGLLYYFTGAPCLRGHVAQRHVAGGNCVVCAAEHSKARYAREAEIDHEKHREWRAKNPNYRAEYKKLYPELTRAIRSRSEANRRIRSAGGATASEVGKWLASQRMVCYWCGGKCAKDYHIDHYYPLSKGGRHEVSNLVIACPTCNSRKSAKDPEQFRAETWHGTLFSSLINP
jgi:5-methylcytosine-specific restriction endonuclease McrA